MSLESFLSLRYRIRGSCLFSPSPNFFADQPLTANIEKFWSIQDGPLARRNRDVACRMAATDRRHRTSGAKVARGPGAKARFAALVAVPARRSASVEPRASFVLLGLVTLPLFSRAGP